MIPFSDKTYHPLGPKSAETIERQNRYLAQNYDPYIFVADFSDGAWIIDPDGNRALDLLSCYSAVVEHGNPRVRRAVEEQMGRTDAVSRALYNSQLALFGEKLATLTGYDRVLPKSDGGSATDAGLKGLLMHAGARGIEHPNIILTADYFHGRTIPFAASAYFDSGQQAGITVDVPWIKVVENSLDAIVQAVDDNTVGVFIETHKGEGGPKFSDETYFRGVRQLTREKDILFGVDEIQTGLGRCGYMMAWQEYGEDVRPDFVTLGKALGGAYIPVSAVVGSEEYMSIFQPGTDGSTFGGYPLAAAAAIAALDDIVERDLGARSLEMGDYITGRLNDIPGITAKNRGLLIRVEVLGIETTKYACMEMLLGDHDPRVFMKHGHNDPEKNVAFARVAPPPAAIKKKDYDSAHDNTIAPVLAVAGRT